MLKTLLLKELAHKCCTQCNFGSNPSLPHQFWEMSRELNEFQRHLRFTLMFLLPFLIGCYKQRNIRCCILCFNFHFQHLQSISREIRVTDPPEHDAAPWEMERLQKSDGRISPVVVQTSHTRPQRSQESGATEPQNSADEGRTKYGT